MSSPSPAVLRRRGDVEIQDVSAWILRVGVVASVSLMLLGLIVSLAGRIGVDQMRNLRFATDFGVILRGALAFEGLALIELGILVLVLTPIVRVFSSMVIFAAVERDWFYAAVTLLVLIMTLLSLLVLN